MTNKEIIESTERNPFPKGVLMEPCLEDSIFYNMSPALKNSGNMPDHYFSGIPKVNNHLRNYEAKELWIILGLEK